MNVIDVYEINYVSTLVAHLLIQKNSIAGIVA